MKRIMKSIIKCIMIILFVVSLKEVVYAQNDYEIYKCADELIENVSNEDVKIKSIQQVSEREYVVELSDSNGDNGYVKIKDKNGKYIPVDFSLDERYEEIYSSGSSIITESRLSGLKYCSYGLLSNRSYISESYIESVTKKYACGVMALTEIAEQEGILKNKSIADTFNTLWKYTNTETISEENGISYGSTALEDMISGMEKYVKNSGFSIKTTTETKPSFSFFKKAVNNGYSSTLAYTINVKNGTSYRKSAHVVSVIGWYIYKDSEGKKYNYLAVADGWRMTQHYMLIEEIDFVTSYGTTYNIY